MKTTWKTIVPALVLFLVSMFVAAAVGGVYMLTKDTIAEAALEAQARARTAVMESAASMEELPADESGTVDWCYEAYDAAGNVIGYVSQITVIGFGGEIEVTVGMDMDGAVTAINVGGSNFSETSGLGAKTREPAFTDQFKGVSGMLVLKQDIDSVTGASVSSGAVVSGVNKALVYMTALLPQTAAADVPALPLSDEELAILLPGETQVQWMGGGAGIDGWWQAESGSYIVQATGFGEGPIVVKVGFDKSATVTGIVIGDENFMESPGRGDAVLAEDYWSQFIGVKGAQTYGQNGIDAISGATVTSDATLSAINACLSFDPDNTGSVIVVATDDSPSGEATQELAAADPNPPASAEEAPAPADAETGATGAAKVTPAPTPVPDAETGATGAVETVPAATPVPTAVPTAVPVTDGASGATGAAEVTPAPTPDAATAATSD